MVVENFGRFGGSQSIHESFIHQHFYQLSSLHGAVIKLTCFLLQLGFG